ncbi:PAS domain S-box protein [Opitutus sp. GAS368]|uniref:hybrid sensor histidine kinase/response regulator n=1 Tax=Opitutus sp. GAS368 TaxID=1882749 RepID=UPI00087D3877|nr:PAS domain S-box protein [Opitutus sp. GAS368]SDS54596.1 PAS domain S-box-containing protein [Opitutus sp. GAS368]
MHSLPASNLPPPRRPASLWSMSFKVAGIYAVLGSAWLVFSNLAVAGRGGMAPETDWPQTAQGLGFVWVTAALLVLLVRHYLRSLQQAESLRWAGEPQFRSLVEQSLVGVYLIQDNRFVYVNPRLAEIFGYPADDIISKLTVPDLVAASDRALVAENLTRRLTGEVAGLNYSFRGLHAFGWPLQLEVFGSRIDYLGRPAIIGTLLDVTDRQEAEAALRESEARYRLLIQTAPEAIVVLDVEQGRFVDYNHQAELFFDMPPDQLNRYGSADLSPKFQPDGRRSDEVSKAYLERAVAGETPAFEWIHRSLTGREIPCEIRLVRLPAHGRTLVRGSLTDITERRRTAEALARSQENYRQLFEQANDAILLCSADGRLVDVNRHTVSISGFSREELLAMSAVDIIAPEDHDYLRHCLDELARQGMRFSTYRFRRKDGSIFFGETSTKLLADGRLLAMVRDITERRQVEEQKRKLEEELRQAQKLQAIGTLAGGIAHDFNNILAAILGNAQLLKIQLAPEHEGQRRVSQILVASNRAKDLVQQILMFSRQREQERRVLDLAAIVSEATRLIEVTLPPAVRLELAIPRDLPVVLADPTQIHQVVVNLCTNAQHAMREHGGLLEVALAVVALPEEGSESKPSLPAGRYVCLRVADNGHGMDGATLQRIYEPFFTTKAVGDGTGLGLAVVHGIVESHRGAIAVNSHPGQGTTFRLFFPVHDDQPAQPVKPAIATASGRNQHIVFVDDEMPIAEVAKVMLPRLGYRVSVFNNPRDALDYVRENAADIDLLMTDFSMPDMNGIDLIRAAAQIRPGLPAVLLTGYGRPIDSRAAVGLNIRETINKPFTMGNLAGAIQGALGPKK